MEEIEDMEEREEMEETEEQEEWGRKGRNLNPRFTRTQSTTSQRKNELT